MNKKAFFSDHGFSYFGWEGDFVKNESIEVLMIGPLRIDIRKD